MRRALHVAATEFGVRTLLVPQLDQLQEKGWDVHVACRPDNPAGFSNDLKRFRPTAVSFPRSPKKLRELGTAVRRFRRLVTELKPDLIHLHSPAAALALRLKASNFGGAKVAYTVHGFAHQWDKPMPLHHVASNHLEVVLSRRTDLLLFQSQEDYEEACRHGYAGRKRLLGNGVEDDWFSIPPSKRNNRPLRVLFIGRLVRSKGILDLLNAFELTDNAELLIVGGQLATERDGCSSEVAARVSSRPLRNRVALLGELPREDVMEAMHSVDTLCLPSYREGVPRSVLEALAAGRPAIVSDCRGCRELVADGVNGFLVPRGSPELLASALRRMERLNEERYSTMAMAARESVDPLRREHHVFEILAHEYSVLTNTEADLVR